MFGPNVAKRLWAQTAVLGADDCWLWRGQKNSSGYGHMRIGGRRGTLVTAHRLAYEFGHNANITGGLCVLHRCDTPLCVNPRHLFLGTRATNSDDMIAKGRARHPKTPGELNGNAKLTWETVRAIRAAEGSCTEIGKRFGTSSSNVHLIRTNQHWVE